MSETSNSPTQTADSPKTLKRTAEDSPDDALIDAKRPNVEDDDDVKEDNLQHNEYDDQSTKVEENTTDFVSEEKEAGSPDESMTETKQFDQSNSSISTIKTTATVTSHTVPSCDEPVKTTLHRIPNNFVGLVIGKKGEQIIRLQAESECKVQIAQDSYGMPDREVTLTGTDQQIQEATNLIDDIIKNASFANAPHASPSQAVVEIPIPGSKVGLLIGKNGDTIKQLQEKADVKMVMIQESNEWSYTDKPLRITGDQLKVDKARQMVMDLLESKETPNGYGAQNENRDMRTYAVPVEKAGLVIGKGGESVKEIIRMSGAYVEIQKQPCANPNIKVFNISGTPSQIEYAIRLICDRANLPNPNMGGVSSQPAGYQWSQMGAGSQVIPPMVNHQTGQADYSMAWADYYRRQGMNEYADQIMRSSGQPAQQPQAPASGDYSQQWEQYSRQWMQWQQQQWAYYQQGGQPANTAPQQQIDSHQVSNSS